MTEKSRLRLYESPADAAEAARASNAGDNLEAHRLGARSYLKKPGQPNIEPRYLCVDGRWRKWDNIEELAAIG